MNPIQVWLDEARTYEEQKLSAARQQQAVALLTYANDAIESARQLLYMGETNAPEQKTLLHLAQGTDDVIKELNA